MFLYVCKQTFRKFYGYIAREFLRIKIRNFQGIIFVWTRTYWEILKSALVLPLRATFLQNTFCGCFRRLLEWNFLGLLFRFYDQEQREIHTYYVNNILQKTFFRNIFRWGAFKKNLNSCEKKTDNIWFSGVFRMCKMEKSAWHELIK